MCVRVHRKDTHVFVRQGFSTCSLVDIDDCHSYMTWGPVVMAVQVIKSIIACCAIILPSRFFQAYGEGEHISIIFGLLR